ncbi:Mitochondrial carrier protein [Aspergillus sp. HF37]|nr:Mitochondrial carrier protein [Aspergillus sp. HF37]
MGLHLRLGQAVHAGALAAVVVDLTVYPFDTLKTRVQSPEYEKLYKDSRTGALRRNVLFRGLYQGIWSVVLSTIPSSAAFFTTYEAAKRTLNTSSSDSENETKPECNRVPITHSLPTPLTHAIASVSAETVACLMTTPAEVVKQNAQVVDGTGADRKTPPVQGNASGWACLEDERKGSRGNTSTSTNSRGTKGRGWLGLRVAGGGTGQGPTATVVRRFRHQPWKLWSGYFTLVGRNLPFTGLQFPIFEFVRARVLEGWAGRKYAGDGSSPSADGGRGQSRWDQGVERVGLTGLSASVSGTIASITTAPVDVVKTRVMLSARDSVGGGEQQGKPRPSSFAVGRQIVREEGVKGLFRGGAIRAGWTAVSLSMYLSIYEGSRFYLENRRRERDNLG